MAVRWSLRTYLEFGAFPGAVPCARLHARAVLWEWSLTWLTEQVELLVSELVTNAVQESRLLGEFTTVRFWLLSDGRKLLIQVWDASQCPPHPEEAGEEIAEGGRGLMLVAAMSDRWSWYPVPETGGKIVWALCGSSAERGSGNAR
jgi:anti-sigma regulatory factor (Ser/Thr protein kinase)